MIEPRILLSRPHGRAICPRSIPVIYPFRITARHLLSVLDAATTIRSSAHYELAKTGYELAKTGFELAKTGFELAKTAQMKKTIAFWLRMSWCFVLTRTSLENSREKKGFARFFHSNFSRDVLFRTQHHLHALPKTTDFPDPGSRVQSPEGGNGNVNPAEQNCGTGPIEFTR